MIGPGGINHFRGISYDRAMPNCGLSFCSGSQGSKLAVMS